MVWLTFIGFIVLAILASFFASRCCTFSLAVFIFYKLGIIKTSAKYEEIIMLAVFIILGIIMGYLDFKNLQLNPFKKQK